MALYSLMVPRDIKPGMKIARLNSDLETVYDAVTEVVPRKDSNGKVIAYKIITVADLKPLILTSRAKIEVQS